MSGALNYANVRPYTIVDSLAELVGPADGVLVLPGWLDWGPRRSYDLSDRTAVRVMYEQVLQEGRRDDLAAFLNAGQLVEVWPELILPLRVRRMWEERFRRLADLAG